MCGGRAAEHVACGGLASEMETFENFVRAFGLCGDRVAEAESVMQKDGSVQIWTRGSHPITTFRFLSLVPEHFITEPFPLLVSYKQYKRSESNMRLETQWLSSGT